MRQFIQFQLIKNAQQLVFAKNNKKQQGIIVYSKKQQKIVGRKSNSVQKAYKMQNRVEKGRLWQSIAENSAGLYLLI